MPICLPKEYREKLKTALKSGELAIEKLYNLSDIERHKLLSKYVSEENAKIVNAKFEQAMLSNQKNAFVNWIKRNTSFTDPIRKDMIKKVEKVCSDFHCVFVRNLLVKLLFPQLLKLL